MKTGAKLTAALLLLVGLILVNYLSSALPARIDLTAERIYTLSPGSRNIVRQIDEPIQVEFFFSRGIESLPVSFKNYASRVQEMLRQYSRDSRGRLTLTVIDPRPDTPEEERALAAGLNGQQLATGETLFFGIIVTQVDQQQVIPFINPNRERFLEYDISQLLYSVQKFDRPRLGLISGLPLSSAGQYAMPGQPTPQDMVVVDEWSKAFEVVSIQMGDDSLPPDLDALAVVHPTGLSASMNFAIDQFLLSGRPLFLALDPSSRHFKTRSQQNMFGMPPPNTSSDLPELLAGWGIEYDADQVVADLDFATTVQIGPGNIIHLPTWTSLSSAAFNADAMPTTQLSDMLLIEPGHFSLRSEAAARLRLTPLIESSERSALMPRMVMDMTAPDAIARQVQPEGRRHTIAGLVQGSFTTAFPNGIPAPEGEENDAPARPPSGPQLTESAGESVLVLIADTDWLLDEYSVRRISFFGYNAAEPANDNLAFASNTLEFLSGSPDLISIRSKGTSVRPFEVVRRMERQAQERYQQQLTALEARIADVQGKLNELRGQRSEGNRLVAPPELEEAILEFQRQEAAMRAERREIRKALREDIERLETVLLLLNLLTVPALVSAFGVSFFIARGRMRRHQLD